MQRVRLAVGTWLGVTDPAALRKVRRAKAISLRIVKTPEFHVKHASFRSRKTVVAFTGSANFTAKGLGGQGELVVEVTDKRPSSTDSVERDVFQRVWTNDTFSDALTDKVIAAYAKKRKPPKLLRRQGARTGKSLLKQFGVLSKRSSAQKNDGAVLWLPVTGSLSDATVDALEQEARRKGDHYVSLTKSLFDRIRMGARRVWLLDLQGRAKDRRLRFRDVIDHKELPTESEGRYFAILARIRRHIPLTRGNKKRLKDLRLVRRVDSLACEPQTLRPGANSKVAKLLALSQPVGKR